MAKYAIGLDFGTSSVRALIVDCADGIEVGTSVWNYPSGSNGILSDPKNPEVARQAPGDYVQGICESIRLALEDSKGHHGFSAKDIVGIGVDTTASTPMPLDKNGSPLAESDKFKGRLDAQAWLWKDHSSYAEAEELTRLSDSLGASYMQMVGGSYSSEWFWAKALRCARDSSDVFDRAHTWMELCDFVPSQLTGAGTDIKRGVCAAGHKWLYNEDWGGLPEAQFLSKLDPRLGQLRDRLYNRAWPSDQICGTVETRLARSLGLGTDVKVAVGCIDAHSGAVGSGVGPGTMVKILGTSACDIMVVAHEKGAPLPFVPGLSGVVRDSVVPGYLGFEAGQAAVGDLFDWFVKNMCGQQSHEKLFEEAGKIRPGTSGLLALDWNNGNRCVLADPRLTGLMVGQTLSTTPPEVLRALIEASAFGALMIIERMEQYGAKIDTIVACGGIAEKSPFILQILADVTGRQIAASRSNQSCALGSAIFGAVAGGAHSSVPAAQRAMAGLKDKVYVPDSRSAKVYGRLFACYKALHDAFGRPDKSISLGWVMKELLILRDLTRSVT